MAKRPRSAVAGPKLARVAVVEPVEAQVLTRHPVLLLLLALGWFAAASWVAWWTLLRALHADPLDDSPADVEALGLFSLCTGRSRWPSAPTREAVILVGRGGGKSVVIARTVVAKAVTFDRRRYPGLAPGETVVCLVLASDRAQASIIYKYVVAALQSDPALAQMIAGLPTQERLVLVNGVEILIATSDYRLIRGRVVLCAACDEAAFWTGISVNPAEAILAALRPSMRLRDSCLYIVSSTYAQRGPTWDLFKRFWGQDDEVMIWKASTEVMNPTYDAALIARALDPASASAEFDSTFRSDLESYCPRETADAAVDTGVRVREREPGALEVGFCDPAGGGGPTADEFVVVFGHPRLAADGHIESVIDEMIAAHPPYSVDAVVAEIAAACRRWGVDVLVGDRYGGAWPSAAFAKYGIGWVPCVSSKSDLYLECLPLLTGGRLRLIDDARLTAQLVALERRSGRSGKDSVDHPPHGHDDRINAAAGCAVLCQTIAADLVEAEAQSMSPAEAAALRAFSRSWGGTLDDPNEIIDHEAGFDQDTRDMRWSRHGVPLW